MSYEQWGTFRDVMLIAILGGAFVLPALFYVFTLGPADAVGKRRGRPWLTALAGLIGLCLSVVVWTQITMVPYPEYAARSQAEYETARVADRDAERQANSAGWYECSLTCDVVVECQGLARDRRGDVIDAAGQTSCNRARRICLDRCHERFPRD